MHTQNDNFTKRGPTGRLLGVALVGGFAALLMSCAERGTPTQPERRGVRPLAVHVDYGEIIEVHVLKRSRAIRTESASFVATPAKGGVVDLVDAGLTVVVPPEAVSEEVTITVTAVGGEYLVYDFQPHGLTFARPVELQQKLKATKANKDASTAERLESAYYPTAEAALVNGVGKAVELIPTTFDPGTNKIKWGVTHFSGYMVSSGRKLAY